MRAHTRRRGLVVLMTPLMLVLSLSALPPGQTAVAAAADPVPGLGEEWPMCGVTPDTDGKYCVVSRAKNGVPIVHPDSGSYQLPSIDLIGSGDVRFGVLDYLDGAMLTVDNGSGGESVMADGNISPDDVYRLTVNTGDIVPRELYGRIRNVTYTTGGKKATGYTFTMTFQPTPMAWVNPEDTACTVDGCGDETTVANPFWVYEGFVTGYVTDLAGWPATERDLRTGFVHVYNAQDADLRYDYATNTLVVRLANAHLKSPGVPATGSYQTFIPYPMLTGLMQVPDPASLTGGSFVVSRSADGSTAAVPFSLTHTNNGVAIDIANIIYSNPTYRIKPKRTAPGAPRLRRVERVAPRTVRLRFLAPLANGGAQVKAYQARCHRPGGSWVRASGLRSPITVRGVSRRTVRCNVRAVNRIGAGPWSVTRSG